MANPITPPPELVMKCWDELRDQTQILDAAKAWDKAIALAYQAGANQGLEACIELLDINGCSGKWVDMLRAARRPPALSLKAQALNDLDDIPTHDEEGRQVVDLSNIRLALESLPQ